MIIIIGIYILGFIGIFTLGFFFGYMSGKTVYQQKKELKDA